MLLFKLLIFSLMFLNTFSISFVTVTPALKVPEIPYKDSTNKTYMTLAL